MKRKSNENNKSRSVTISATKVSEFGINVISKAVRVANAIKDGKITIKVEKM